MTTRIHFPALAGAALLAMFATACTPTSDPETGRSSAPSAGLPAGNPATGLALAERKSQASGQSCIDCHGQDGNAPLDATYPRIGGQYPDYIAHVLVQYRDGNREHALMNPQAIDLTDQEIADLAAWFGSRPTTLRDLTTLP